MVNLPSTPQVQNGQFYIVNYPCPCGRERCTQPVVINSHHALSLLTAQQERESRLQLMLAAEAHHDGHFPDNLLQNQRRPPDAEQ